MYELEAPLPFLFFLLFLFWSLPLFPYTATSCTGLEVTPGPINHSNRQQPKHISQMKHLFCSASESLHSPPSISLLPLFFIRLLMVYKLHIMVPPLLCAKAFFLWSLGFCEGEILQMGASSRSSEAMSRADEG